jgi:hypothetical protein
MEGDRDKKHAPVRSRWMMDWACTYSMPAATSRSVRKMAGTLGGAASDSSCRNQPFSTAQQQPCAGRGEAVSTAGLQGAACQPSGFRRLRRDRSRLCRQIGREARTRRRACACRRTLKATHRKLTCINQRAAVEVLLHNVHGAPLLKMAIAHQVAVDVVGEGLQQSRGSIGHTYEHQAAPWQQLCPSTQKCM